MKKILLGIAVMSLSVALLDAQPQRNMDAIRIWRLTEQLELTEEQTATFLPILQIHERKMREAQKEIGELAEKGEKLLEDKKLSQKQVDKLVKEYMDQQKRINDLKADFISSMHQYLTPRQQVLFLGFEHRFRQDLRDYMRKHRGMDGKSRRP